MHLIAVLWTRLIFCRIGSLTLNKARLKLLELLKFFCSVLDPDPDTVGSETFCLDTDLGSDPDSGLDPESSSNPEKSFQI